METQEELNKTILAAAKLGNVYILRDCINKGAEVNCQYVDYHDWTPLHRAAMYGSIEGQTLLHLAALKGRKEVVELLLKEGASMSVVDTEGKTPLHRAARYGYTEVVDLLIKKGASLSVVDNKFWTPLHRAARYGSTKVVDLLLMAGASLSVVNKQGQTPLHLAALEGSTEVVDLMIKAGASLSVVNNKGKTPYDVARDGARDLLERIIDAAVEGNADTLQDCFNKGAEVNCQNSDLKKSATRATIQPTMEIKTR